MPEPRPGEASRPSLTGSGAVRMALLGLLLILPGAPAMGYSERVERARDWIQDQLPHRQWRCLHRLWEAESGWAIHARTGRAYGIPQALPGRRMAAAERPGWGPAWDDWRHDPRVQIRWGQRYIRARYGTPCRARAAQLRKGWY